MNYTTTIRFARDDDRPAIAAFHADSWRDAYRGMLPDDYLSHSVNDDLRAKWSAQSISDRDVLLIAETDTKIVGFIAVWCQPDPFIDNLHVRSAYRSNGLGRQLMIKAVVMLIERGHHTLSLDVFVSNHRAIKFYKGLGGMEGKRMSKDFFGNPVDLVTISWPNLSSFSTEST